MPTEEVEGVAALQAGSRGARRGRRVREGDRRAQAAPRDDGRGARRHGALEAEVPAELWTLGTYQELLFLDANQAGEILDVE